MINVSSLNFNRGLIINAQGVQLSDFVSYDFKPQHKNDFVINASFDAKLVNSITKKESFLLKNHIELSADELEHFCQIFDTDESINSVIADESSTNDIFLIIQCSKVELIIKKETIKPSGELTDKVKEALKHYDPYHKLMDVFNNYGYFLPKKMILGHKIYRVTCLTVDEYLTEPDDKNNDTKWTTFDDFSENKLEIILNQWEKCMSSYNFDLSYLVSINGELIMKNKIREWIKFCLECDLDSLQVIGCKELYPLYEIFDLTLRQEIEFVLGISMQIDSTLGIDNQGKIINRNNIKERVLMAGTVPIKDPPYSYSVKFPICFKSNNYKVFGKFITRDDEPIDEVIIKFEFMDTYGFLIFMEDYNFTYKDPKIAWILIGIPDEVGYFSTSTRKINVLGSGNEPFALKSNNKDIILEVPENLPQDSVIVFSFNHPPSNDEPKFITKLLNYQYNKILFNVYCHDYESSDSEENDENSKFFDREDDNVDSKYFENEGLIIKSASSYFKDKEKYSNSDLKTDNVELAHENNFSNKENVIGEGSNSNYVVIDPKISYNKNNSNSNDTKIDDFEQEKSNYDKRPSEKSQIKASKYSIQWFILRNSDIADLIYLNKIGQGFYLIKSKSFSTKNDLKSTTIHPLMVHLDNIDDDNSSTYYDDTSVYTVGRKISSTTNIPGILAQAFDSSSAVGSLNPRSIETLKEDDEEEDWDTNSDDFINPLKSMPLLPSIPISPISLTPSKFRHNRSNSLSQSASPKSFYRVPSASESWDDDFDLDNDEINVPDSVEQVQFSLGMDVTNIRDFVSQIEELKTLRNKKQFLATIIQSKITKKWSNGFTKSKKKSIKYKDLETRFKQDWEEAAVIIDLSDVAKDRKPTFGGGKRVTVDIEKIPSERHMQVLKKIIIEELGENVQDEIFMDDNDKDSINNEAVRKTSAKKKEQETKLKQTLVDNSRRKENFRISVEVMPSLISHLKKLQNRLSEHLDKLGALASNE
ncbi:chitin synthase regulatory factor chr2 [Gigaspora margarita]|uniref:Chitin synthase regulatory factor chr2 n=1 Tax=Gigaspora margarita TaxID=4874 RepID=A0A8H4AX36_GIGMA|nr:chitin synthase regulatory factor chr2 [Gigaspora margarita]